MKRIQRQRTEGWKMPDNTIYVGRPTKWGNPFKVGGEFGQDSKEDAVKMYRVHVIGKLVTGVLDISELRGKNLACFCKVGEPCHADVLLELANR